MNTKVTVTVLNELGNFVSNELEYSEDTKKLLTEEIADLTYLMLPLDNKRKLVMSGDMIKKSVFIIEEIK